MRKLALLGVVAFAAALFYSSMLYTGKAVVKKATAAIEQREIYFAVGGVTFVGSRSLMDTLVYVNAYVREYTDSVVSIGLYDNGESKYSLAVKKAVDMTRGLSEDPHFYSKLSAMFSDFDKIELPLTTFRVGTESVEVSYSGKVLPRETIDYGKTAGAVRDSLAAWHPLFLACQAAVKERGYDIPLEVVQAQFVYETVIGRTPLFKYALNGFGIKYNPSRCKTYVLEYDDCGSDACRFCAFATAGELANAYAGVVTQQRYTKHLENFTTPDWVDALYRGGYASNKSYKTTLLSIIKRYL